MNLYHLNWNSSVLTIWLNAFQEWSTETSATIGDKWRKYHVSRYCWWERFVRWKSILQLPSIFLISSKYSLTRNLIYCVFQNRRWILSFEERFGKKSDVSKGIRNWKISNLQSLGRSVSKWSSWGTGNINNKGRPIKVSHGKNV